MDFSSGSPIVDLNSVMHMTETGSTISDVNGNLLFYTNGDTIWNKNHSVMANGTGLINCQSSTQGGLIIKKPASNSLYYIFTNDCAENNGINGVHYSIVDISLNGGLGAVISKNILLYAPSTEKLAAAYHCNNNDVWIVGQYRNSNQFSAYLLSATGINTTALVSNIGYFHNDDALPCTGQMRFSPNREKLVVVYSIYNPNGVEELYDFDSSTGSIYNLITLPSDTSEYGVAFSNDNQKLYIESGGGGGVANKIFQYDLSSNTPSLIINSKTLIHSNKCNSPVFDLQNGPDGKIYGTRFYLDSMAVINNPQFIGTLCNYNHNSISLNGRICHEMFPQYLENYFLSSSSSTLCVSNVKKNSENNVVRVYPNPFSDVIYFENSGEEKTTIEINNLFNEIIYDTEIPGNEIKIDIGFLKAGLYFLNVKINNQRLNTIKLIKT